MLVGVRRLHFKVADFIGQLISNGTGKTKLAILAILLWRVLWKPLQVWSYIALLHNSSRRGSLCNNYRPTNTTNVFILADQMLLERPP